MFELFTGFFGGIFYIACGILVAAPILLPIGWIISGIMSGPKKR